MRRLPGRPRARAPPRTSDPAPSISSLFLSPKRGGRGRSGWGRSFALAPARALLRRCNVPHAEHVVTGDRVGMINEVAAQLGVSEIVIGTARKNSLTRILEDSVSRKLLDTSPVPVRIVVGDTTSRLERFAVPASIFALLLALFVVSE